MKTFALLVAAVAAQDACECVGPAGLPDTSFFTDAGYPEEYGSACGAWDTEDPSCQEDGANYGVDWCTEAWCYTSPDCESAIPTVFFAETEYKDTLAFSVGACAEDSSIAMYASAMAATIAVVAASI